MVMAAVAKAQTLKSNKTLILCIAVGKNCDAKMAKQPALVRASKTEMVSQDDRGPGDCMGTNEFGERSLETESKDVQVTQRAPKSPERLTLREAIKAIRYGKGLATSSREECIIDQESAHNLWTARWDEGQKCDAEDAPQRTARGSYAHGDRRVWYI